MNTISKWDCHRPGIRRDTRATPRQTTKDIKDREVMDIKEVTQDKISVTKGVTAMNGPSEETEGFQGTADNLPMEGDQLEEEEDDHPAEEAYHQVEGAHQGGRQAITDRRDIKKKEMR